MDINVPIGSGALGLLPNFVGYWILWKAMSGRGNVMGKGVFVARKLLFFAALVLLLKYVLLWIPLVNILGVMFTRVADILFVVMAYRVYKKNDGR